MNPEIIENLLLDLLGKPIPPRVQPGYYPGYSTLSQRNFWDEATRKLIDKRVNEIPSIRFFSTVEAEFLTAVAGRVLPQDDRDQSRRIPIVPWIDERLHEGRIDGYRFEGMPPDGEAYRLGLQGIDACAQENYGRHFTGLTPVFQEDILRGIHDANPAGGHDIWKRLPVHRFWLLLLHDVCSIYYSHPWAWDEIGYGGPAYPRGYMRLENGEPEPWEVREDRYGWSAPVYSKTHLYEFVAGLEDHYGSPGQGGTH